jgi:hypothetical protein
MSEETDFQVIDKRRVGREPKEPAGGSQAEAPPAAAASAPEAPGAPPSGPETAAAGPPPRADAAGSAPGEPGVGAEQEADEEDDRVPMNVAGLAQFCVGMLHEVAWVKMGLVPDPQTGVMAPDLPQARLAIDCVGDLVHRLEPHVDGRTLRELQTMVQNLKINFVRQNPGPGGG